MDEVTGKLVVFLRGKKASLRPLLKTDLPNLLRWINDQEIIQYLRQVFPSMEETETDFLKKIAENHNELVLAITTPEGNHIGVVGLHHINWVERIATLGIFIGEKDYWEKGIGSEVENLICQYAFCSLNLEKICASVVSFNERSYNCLVKKCGFHEEGRLERQFYRNGRYWDEILLALFKDEWVRNHLA